MKKTKIDHYTDKEALEFHSFNKPGKIEINSSKQMTTKRDLALAYSPGVAVPVQAIADDNEKFVRDVYEAMLNDGESSFDPITLGVSAVLSIGSAIFGSKQAEKQRQAMFNAKLMELESTERLTREQIQAMKETERLKILSNTLTDYALGLQGESTKRQRDTALFVGIMGVGLAVMYATIQLFKT